VATTENAAELGAVVGGETLLGGLKLPAFAALG
jgi:hypothetical protein